MSPADSNPKVPPGGCPECGARVKPTDARCWLCGRELVVTAEIVEALDESPFAASWSPRVGAAPQPFQFSLESLLLVITLVAVCLGAFVATPGLGVLALIVAAPALLRTFYEGRQARQRGKSFTLAEKLAAFAASAGIALAALSAAAAAFFAACTASLLAVCFVGSATGNGPVSSGVEQTVFITCVVICIAASITGFVGIFWLTWPRL
jgi:hypothetical protein